MYLVHTRRGEVLQVNALIVNAYNGVYVFYDRAPAEGSRLDQSTAPIAIFPSDRVEFVEQTFDPAPARAIVTPLNRAHFKENE